jgi:hypothetical protein
MITVQNGIGRGTLVSVVLAAVLGATATLFAGPLTPPGTPGPTMRTLTQMEPRTPLLGNPPYNITQSGSYYLVQNVTGVSGQHGIVISASDVTLDLNGMTLKGGPGTQSGIFASSTVRNVTIRNGAIGDWAEEGIEASGGQWHVEDVKACGNGGNGIALGDGAIVYECQAVGNGTNGVSVYNGSLIENCVAASNMGNGIRSDADCVLDRCASVENGQCGFDLWHRSTVRDCVATSNTLDGISSSFPVENLLITHSVACWNRGPNGGIVVGDSSEVRDCVAANNSAAGIHVGQRCLIAGNSCTANGTSMLRAGISCSSNCRVEGNHVAGNHDGITATGIGNAIIGNTSQGNVHHSYFIPADNFFGAEVTTATLMNSAANSLINISIP